LLTPKNPAVPLKIAVSVVSSYLFLFQKHILSLPLLNKTIPENQMSQAGNRVQETQTKMIKPLVSQ
jgi:hypothetical protein